MPIYVGETKNTPVHANYMDYNQVTFQEDDTEDATSLVAFNDAMTVTWINMDGIHWVEQVQAACEGFGVHPLWIEDILNPNTRAKTDVMDNMVLVIARMLIPDETANKFRAEQVSIILGPTWVLTFQQQPGDVWDKLRARIRSSSSRIRRMGADYLLHALLDSIVDHYFVVLEETQNWVDDLEAVALDPHQQIETRTIFDLKNELADFRRTIWPMRESVSALLRLEDEIVGKDVQPFFRDLYDHVVQTMDMLERSRERVSGVFDLHLAVTSHRLNDIMKVLTIVSTVFIPLTFIVGLYGMNFKDMPELTWTYGYVYVWGLMIVTGVLSALAARKWLW